MENVWKTGTAELQRLLDAEGLTGEVRRRQARMTNGAAAAKAVRLYLSRSETPRELVPGWERLARCLEEEDNVELGFQRFLGVRGLDVMRDMPKDDLKDIATFFVLARQEANSLENELGTRTGEVQSLVAKLDPYLCPGFSLRIAVRRGRVTSSERGRTWGLA